MIKNKYGYFDDKNREFVITDPQTPRPWFNYMWNERYAGLISHTGGGYSYLDCPRDNRLTRMRYNCLPWDRPGRYVVVKDAETGEYWSLSWAPTITIPYDRYECHHGMGYTRIITEYKGIRGEITYFVPREEMGEIWNVALTNLSDTPRNLEIYAFTELLMGNALNDLINQPNDKHFTDIHFDNETQSLIATRRYWVLNKKVSVVQPNIDWKYILQFTTTLQVTGFDASLDSFIGKWRSEANPQAIETGTMTNTEITAGDPVAALQMKERLTQRETLNFSIFMKVSEKDSAILTDINTWKSARYVEEKFAAVKRYWDNYFSVFQVDTPDEKVNIMLNTWNAYQTAANFDMARNSGYYHGGLLFGIGLRDQFQDILGMVMVEPMRVRERLLHALQYQFKDGSTLHNFFKLAGTGERTRHSDTPLWIPFGLIKYYSETGDDSIFKEKVSYYKGGEGTVYEHMVNAINFALGDTTERGLPRIMKGDWNDTLDHIGPKGKGETIWGAFFLGYILKEAISFFEFRNDSVLVNKYTEDYEKLSKTINELAWTGEWYLRAFRDNGKPVGIPEDDQGRLFLNTQSWSVISEMAPPERAKSALKSCLDHLETPYGMQICWPAYRRIDDTVGLISRCVPGKKENGAVFNHASAWFVLAALLNGQVDDAYRIYQKMLPINSSVDIDRYETEPYVFSEYVTSPEHPTQGQASHSWLTGSAVWMFYISYGYLLGIRPVPGGLLMDPRIPAEWDKVKITRKFRGKTLHIQIHNPDHVNMGVKSITINSKIHNSRILDPEKFTGRDLNVEIVL
ncbi:MAG: glycosyl transferase family 36 [Candidatus Marinimicrobia bacterium]|nr:glycosyl transferase family 36 [Candidatus Neomarinimicrobiota bacterium]